MSVLFQFLRSPEVEFHFNALGIDQSAAFVLHTNDVLIETVQSPFEEGTSATVFHVHEVMRIVLSQLPLTEREGHMMVHSNGIKSGFERLSYHAASVWSDWRAAVDDAGGAIRTILQRMFGVRIRQNGWWIPHPENKYIEVDDEWSIIDDVVTTSDLLEICSDVNDLWISMNTGLRLLRNSVKPDDCSESLSHFFGQNHRFPSASSWLQWSLENGTSKDLPTDQGKAYYFKGIINDEIPRYPSTSVLKNGPNESEWWARDLDSPEVPKFRINDRNWALGILWRYDSEQEYWKPTYPHLHQIGESSVIDISAPGLGLRIVSDEAEVDDNELGSLNVRHSLSNHLITEHLRAVRVLLIELGFAQPPIATDSRIGGLGLSGSNIPSPFSDMYFINSNPSSTLGVVINSPIEISLRREILRNNWYVIE